VVSSRVLARDDSRAAAREGSRTGVRGHMVWPDAVEVGSTGEGEGQNLGDHD
jgi:hypothetical protein